MSKDQEYYERNRERILAQNKARRESLPDSVKLDRKIRYGKKQKQRYWEIRLECLAYYGGKCTCCGETRPEFLAFDHINGGGTKSRREREGSRVIWWIKKNNFPPDYRVLCHNCNSAFGFYGSCPHQTEKA